MLKPILAVVVLAGVGWHFWERTEEWRLSRQESQVDLPLNYGWLVGSSICYLSGLSLCGLFWRRLLADAGMPTSRVELLRAYFIGHLGKYIPGKAWVILLRAGLLRGEGRSSVHIALTVTYETLAMMAVGGMVASVALLVAVPERWTYGLGAAAIALTLGLLVHPRCFGWLANRLTLPFRRDARDIIPQFRYDSLIRGAGQLAAGWVLIGLSLVALTRAIEVTAISPRDYLLLIGATALATVAGFLVLFAPSGLGPRELIVTELLVPRLGPAAAVGASLLLRMTWVVAELGAAGVLYWWPIHPKKSSSASSSPPVTKKETSAP